MSNGAVPGMRELIHQSVRFLAVGLVNTAVGLLSIYAIIFFFNAHPGLANAIGYAIGLAVSFVLNRFWTFSDSQSIVKVLPRYLTVAGISYLLNLGVVLIGTDYFGIGPYLVQLFGMAVYTPTMFLGCRFFVFNGKQKGDEKILSIAHTKPENIEAINNPGFSKKHPKVTAVIELGIVGLVPLILAMSVLGLWHRDLSIPFVYSGSDDVWQLILTKVLKDTGWILDNPFLGAPDIAHWHFNAAVQTSALHSILMLALSQFIDDAVKLQQIYYILNFSLISITSYLACRLLGIARFAAASIAVLFSFTSFRIGWIFYAYLANYFTVPLALVPIFWILTGELGKFFPKEQPLHSGIKSLLRSGKFWISFFCVLLVTLSDGYYAFFTLLLLGFATAMRAIYGDIMTPARLLAPVLLITTLILVALVVSLPISTYQHAHPAELYPDGKADPTLFKRPFEAEVYSTSLKLLVAPIPEHHIKNLGQLGQRMVDNANAARKIPTGLSVSLGTIGSVLLLACFAVLAMLALHQASPNSRKTKFPDFLNNNPILWAAVILSVFIFLCSTSGGTRALIALIYPTIWAYDRFPLFLIFCLFAGAGAIATALVRDTTRSKFTIAVGITLALTVAGLYDQIPFNAAKGNAQTHDKFLAERSFIHHIESMLPAGAMVYQYPHSQYLSDSKYYGWGSFSHLRLYLHSTDLRWSNGASKNSPVENWHERIAGLPITDLITEVEAAGFQGLVIDRSVVPGDEYQKVRAALANQGLEILEDAPGSLAFARLKDPGFRIVYDPAFREAERLVITDQSRLTQSIVPSLISKPALQKFLAQKQSASFPLAIERALNPGIFKRAELLSREAGEKAIQPLEAMKGQMLCSNKTGPTVASQKDCP
ncbi:MAG: GtrA family protein [Methylococcales bacterium]|nr:GtrA family protein [Methylococcales bacterium]